jgi:hypothetical protein
MVSSIGVIYSFSYLATNLPELPLFMGPGIRAIEPLTMRVMVSFQMFFSSGFVCMGQDCA